MAGTATPSTVRGQSGSLFVIECINANARYTKLLTETRPSGLKFTNGRATVTKDELDILRSQKALWGRQIDLYGRLRFPGRLHQPTVIRGLDQTGMPPVPVNAQTGKPISEEEDTE
jgi:hypothetical protein